MPNNPSWLKDYVELELQGLSGLICEEWRFRAEGAPVHPMMEGLTSELRSLLRRVGTCQGWNMGLYIDSRLTAPGPVELTSDTERSSYCLSQGHNSRGQKN